MIIIHKGHDKSSDFSTAEKGRIAEKTRINVQDFIALRSESGDPVTFGLSQSAKYLLTVIWGVLSHNEAAQSDILILHLPEFIRSRKKKGQGNNVIAACILVLWSR